MLSRNPHFATHLQRIFVVFSSLVIVLAAGGRASGQIFRLEAGTSSLYQAHGGSVGFHTQNYDGWLGIGSMEGVRVGAFMRTKFRGSTLTIGDDAIPFRLGTDVFDTGHYFMGRGVGLTQQHGATRIFSFAGATSRGTGTPYFRTGDAEKGVGLLFLDHPLSDRLSLFSRNVFSSRQSSISGLEWQPWTGVRASVAGGFGANQGYGASSFTVDRDLYTLKAAYIVAGDQFRRITVQQPISSEVDRENVMFTLRPTSSLALTVGRQNFLQPFTQDSPTVRGSVNQYAASFYPGRLSLSGTLFDSRVMGMASRGASFSAGRDLFSRLHVTGNYLWNRAGNSQSFTSILGTFRETLSPRLSFLQNVTHSSGQTNVSFGGNFVSNRVSVGVEYQTLYLPFLTGNQFKQALVLNFQFRPFGNYSFNAGSYVTPDGRVKYTAYGGTYMYRGAPGGGPPGAMTAISFHKYLVQGRVLDEAGRPIRGAALRIDGEVVYSDSGGVFLSRRRRPATLRLEVLLNEFIVPGQFEVVSAPPSVKAEPEGSAHEVIVVLRRTVPQSRRISKPAAPSAVIQKADASLSRKSTQSEFAAPLTGPREFDFLPISRNLCQGLLISFKFYNIATNGRNKIQKGLKSGPEMPMRLGGGPGTSGGEHASLRADGTKSDQSASSSSHSRRRAGRSRRLRPGRVARGGSPARRATSRNIRSVSGSRPRHGTRSRKASLRRANSARRVQLAAQSRKELSSRLRPGGGF